MAHPRHALFIHFSFTVSTIAIVGCRILDQMSINLSVPQYGTAYEMPFLQASRVPITVANDL